MALEYADISSLPIEQFRRFGIACCYRLGCDRNDKSLAKALKLLERSMGPPLDERLRRDAYNAAKSVYLERYRIDQQIDTVSCTLVCACHESPNANLIGNFRAALGNNENLSWDEIALIEMSIFQKVMGE